MSCAARPITAGLILLAATALAGCASMSAAPPTGQAQADASTRAACRQRAEEIYNQQNRAEIYSPQSQVNTPFSANYTPAEAGPGLSQLFAHDRMVSDCVRNTGTGSDRDDATSGKP
jgi:curli biogenesis system outer membrane secretion channel CsgG